MRILVIGADGMLGHRLVEAWGKRHEVVAGLRKERTAASRLPPFILDRARFGVDLLRPDALCSVLDEARPDLVVNAAGIVKQRAESREILASLETNALAPHRLAGLCRLAGARLVHLSTDCVFSGRKGGYSESDEPDPVDLYGRTKLLGEVGGPGCLTLRTSMIGLEIGRASGLVEWFLAQTGEVGGYTQAIFSGLTTTELARSIEHLATQTDPPEGIWHLAADPISKFDLLQGLRDRLPWLSARVRPDDRVRCDRSLCWEGLRARTTYRPPSWSRMMDELAGEIGRRKEAEA